MDLLTWLRAEWDRVLGFGLIILGAVLLVLGYQGVSDSPYVAEQLSYIVSGGLGGLFCLGAGATFLILADLHDEWRKLDRVEAKLDAQHNLAGDGPAAPSTNGRSQAGAPQLPAPQLSGEPVRGVTTAMLLRRERPVVGLGLVSGVLVLALAWDRASSSATATSGVEALAVGVLGLLCMGIATAGSTFWVKRNVQLRKTRLLAPWLADDERRLAFSGGAAHGSGIVAVAPGLTRYHLPGCPSLAGAEVTEIDRRRLPDGLTPCQLCEAG